MRKRLATIMELREKLNTVSKKYYSKEEGRQIKEMKSLPSDVFQDEYDKYDHPDRFFKYEELYSPEEEVQYLRLFQVNQLRVIKNCLIFFTVLAVVGLAVGLRVIFK